MSVRVRYDEVADAAYLDFTMGSDERVGLVHTFEVTVPEEVDSWVALDWQAGRIVGLEVIDASQRLPVALLETAERM